MKRIISDVMDEAEDILTNTETKKVVKSAIIGAVTGSTILGAVLGGSLLGGAIGDMLDGDDDDGFGNGGW